MVENNKEQKAEEQPIEWSLTEQKVPLMDVSSKFRLSRTFGKKDPWIVRAVGTTVDAVVTFFFDVYTAIKIIMKEVM